MKRKKKTDGMQHIKPPPNIQSASSFLETYYSFKEHAHGYRPDEIGSKLNELWEMLLQEKKKSAEDMILLYNLVSEHHQFALKRQIVKVLKEKFSIDDVKTTAAIQKLSFVTKKDLLEVFA